jgi:NAD(P)-dependent dehydrogenase (short-subunit alcohol dehydrogenase family)
LERPRLAATAREATGGPEELERPRNGGEFRMALGLAGRVAVVTGSSRGLGEAIARRLATDEAAVLVSGRNEPEGQRVVQAIRELGGRAVWQRAEVSSATDCEALIQAAVEQFGRLDILVNNAAAMGYGPVAEVTAEQWDEVFATNVRGAFLLTRRAFGQMRRQGGGGNVVNIGTTHIRCPGIDRLSYGCSKAALLALTKAFDRDGARDQIRVNWITVGWVATPRELEYQTERQGDGAKFLAERAAHLPMGRLETPGEIAAGVAFLVSDEAAHITACELNLSGGNLI